MTSNDSDSAYEPVSIPFPHSPTGTTGLQRSFAIAIRKAFKKRLNEIYHYLNQKPEIIKESLRLTSALDDASLDFIIHMIEGIKLDLSPIVMMYLDVTWQNAIKRTARSMNRGDWVYYDKRVQLAFQSDSYYYLDKFISSRQEEIKDVLAGGMSQGDTIPTIVESIRESFSLTSYKAEIIGRTEVVRTHNIATFTAIKNAGVTKEYQWLTSKRENVCTICRPRHGKIYKLDDPSSPMPVRDSHPNCNCSIVPYVRITESEEE